MHNVTRPLSPQTELDTEGKAFSYPILIQLTLSQHQSAMVEMMGKVTRYENRAHGKCSTKLNQISQLEGRVDMFFDLDVCFPSHVSAASSLGVG